MKKTKVNSHLFGFALFFLLLVIVTGCHFLPLWGEENSSIEGSDKSALENISTIYIQSITGDNILQFQNEFMASLKNVSKFKITELLPDTLENLGVLRIKVEDYTIWDNEEPINPFTDLGEFDVSPDTIIIRRNALVNVRISLYEANTGSVLIQKLFSQPFQQIYVGKDEIENKNPKENELKRLTQLLSGKIIKALLEKKEEEEILEFKKGQGYDLISGAIYDFGDWRIRKGNKFAEAGNYDDAIEVWKIVLFEPGKNEPKHIYLQNKAAAHYNLGTVYLRQKNWLKAADHFSKANRINRNMQYAQAWGDSIQAWLEEQKNKEIRSASLEPKVVEIPVETETSKQQTSKEDQKLDLVLHEDLLLKPIKTWPLEPIIKDKFDQQRIPVGNETFQ